MVGGGDPFYLKFWVNRPALERNDVVLRSSMCLLGVPKTKFYTWPNFPKKFLAHFLTGLVKFRLKKVLTLAMLTSHHSPVNCPSSSPNESYILNRQIRAGKCKYGVTTWPSRILDQRNLPQKTFTWRTSWVYKHPLFVKPRLWKVDVE